MASPEGIASAQRAMAKIMLARLDKIQVELDKIKAQAATLELLKG